MMNQSAIDGDRVKAWLLAFVSCVVLNILLAPTAHADSTTYATDSAFQTGIHGSKSPWFIKMGRRQDMEGKRIPAEIIPVPGKSRQAALALQKLGFRILSIDKTISVEAPESLWSSTFNVFFETRERNILPGIEGGDITYRKAFTDKLSIPSDMRNLISDIEFIEPPQFY